MPPTPARRSTTRITGERVATPTGGFNPTWQRHVAAYLLCEPFLPLPSTDGSGRVLDLGCGVGHSYHLLEPRTTVGVDVDAEALAGQDRETVVADMRELPFGDAAFTAVLSVHSLEHVPDPDRVVAEAARVIEPGGVVVFVTPNRLTFGRPDEIIDPYHHVELDPDELRELCRTGFEDVELRGIFGSARYMRIFDAERVALDRLLSRDPLRLRRLVPNAVKRRLYDAMLRRRRRDEDPEAETIEPADFELGTENLAAALDLCAICRRPAP
ncbi:MAG TPA: class I SAM-dependent methyltransferase [Solirubrobacterales bacterium]|nr:class I SAM-dependent methyltransferase [Solirubrobacterales bacterium]